MVTTGHTTANDEPAQPVGIVTSDRKSGVVDRWDAGHVTQPDEAVFLPESLDAFEGVGYLMSVIYDRSRSVRTRYFEHASRL